MTSYTLDAVAEALGVSVRTVEAWIAGHELRAVNVSRDRQSRKQRLRVMQADLDLFLAARASDIAPGKTAPRRRQRMDVEQFV